MTKTILVLRHGEEPAVQPNLDLSGAGSKRAARLATFIPKAYGKPAQIFCAAPSSSSVRCFLTMRPLAAAAKVTIDASYKRDDFAPLAFRLLGDPALAGKLIVVCWTHKELPLLAAYLNVPRAEFPVEWPEDCYDRLYALTYKRDTRPKVKKVVLD